MVTIFNIDTGKEIGSFGKVHELFSTPPESITTNFLNIFPGSISIDSHGRISLAAGMYGGTIFLFDSETFQPVKSPEDFARKLNLPHLIEQVDNEHLRDEGVAVFNGIDNDTKKPTTVGGKAYSLSAGMYLNSDGEVHHFSFLTRDEKSELVLEVYSKDGELIKISTLNQDFEYPATSFLPLFVFSDSTDERVYLINTTGNRPTVRVAKLTQL